MRAASVYGAPPIMNSNHPAEQKTQAHGPRSLSFAIAPIAFGATALWIAIQALRGGSPVAGFGNVAAVALIIMVAIGWGCHFLASRQQIAAGTMPRPLYVVFGLIVLVAGASLAASIAAASLPCRGSACSGDAGTIVTIAIVSGVIAVLLSINTIRFMLNPPLLQP